ncbi:MAG: hypothetical protein ACYTF6_00090 [Planctomycetota bacterium]|jgi:hypothetical protein
MTYTASWNNANAQGRLDAGQHTIRLSDASELAAAINRRRLLTYQTQQDFSSEISAGKYVRQSTVAGATAPPFDNLRASLDEKVLSAPTGTLGGTPPTPTTMAWLWPLADADENKIIVVSEPDDQQVSLFEKLNGSSDWTDPTLTAGATSVRAVHFNELRQTAEWLRRGSWELPVYFAGGLFSILPDTPWITDAIANNGADELRTVGYAVIRTGESPQRGLANATLRPSSYLQITADVDCSVEIYRCLRSIDFINDPPTWNEYDPSASGAWATPGGTGSGDAVLIGSMALTADVPGQLSTSALASALQAMVDGAEQNYLLRRSDTGPETITIEGVLVVKFDLNSPPN